MVFLPPPARDVELGDTLRPPAWRRLGDLRSCDRQYVTSFSALVRINAYRPHKRGRYLVSADDQTRDREAHRRGDSRGAGGRRDTGRRRAGATPRAAAATGARGLRIEPAAAPRAHRRDE